MPHSNGSHLSTLLVKCFLITKEKVLCDILLLLPSSGIYACVQPNVIIPMKTILPC